FPFELKEFGLGLLGHGTGDAFPGSTVFAPTVPIRCSIPVATVSSVSKRTYGMEACSQNVASLSLAKTTSAHAAACRSENPSPTNTVIAPAGFRRSIAAGLHVAQP